MDFYTYASPGAKNDDLRNENTFRDYAECGFNAIFLTAKNGYNGEGWKGSNSEKCFELAKTVGIEKVILDDYRIIDLVRNKELIGEGCQFNSQEELEKFVKDCMSDYAHEKSLFGLRICDEPNFPQLRQCGLVYRAVKKAGKELGLGYIYVHLNMLPLVGDAKIVNPNDGVERTPAQIYEYYLSSFIEATGADTLCVDNYPFRPRQNGGIFLLGYYTGLQILRNVCDKYGINMAFVLQSFEMIHKTKPEATAGFRRITTINEMMLQTNSVLAFGVSEISFYTYSNHGTSESSPYRSHDGSSFITEGGDKTRIYEFGKSAVSHAKTVAEKLKDYKFSGAKILVHESCPKECEELYVGKGEFNTLGGKIEGASFDNSYRFESVKDIKTDSDILLVSELKKDGGKMITLTNVLDIVYKYSVSPMTVKVDLGIDKIKVLRRGEWKEVLLKGGIYTTELNVGEADFIVIE